MFYTVYVLLDLKILGKHLLHLIIPTLFLVNMVGNSLSCLHCIQMFVAKVLLIESNSI